MTHLNLLLPVLWSSMFSVKGLMWVPMYHIIHLSASLVSLIIFLSVEEEALTLVHPTIGRDKKISFRCCWLTAENSGVTVELFLPFVTWYGIRVV